LAAFASRIVREGLSRSSDPSAPGAPFGHNSSTVCDIAIPALKTRKSTVRIFDT
jgi:hypothetical protein